MQRCPRGEQGATLVLAAMMILALFILVAALLEASRFFGCRSEMNIAAQAGAFAGALAVIGGDTLGASDEAVAYAVANGADAAAMSEESAFAFGVWDPVSRQFQPQANASGSNAIRVIATQTETTLSAPFLGSPTCAVSASAIVLYGTVVTQTTCVKPFALASTLIDLDDNGEITEYEVGVALQASVEVSAFSYLKDDNDSFFVVVLPPFWDASEGTYVDLPPEAMGDDALRANIENCNPDLIGAADSVWTKPGINRDPMMQGLTALCGEIIAELCNPSGAYSPDGRAGISVIVLLRQIAPLGATEIKITDLAGLRITRVANLPQEIELEGYFMRTTNSGAVEPGAGLLSRPILVR